jgi:hypothetical protein
MSPNELIENAQHGSVSLKLLPPTILLLIMRYFPSLDSLWNLLRASSQVWRLFNIDFLAITEGILSGPNSVMPPKIRELIRGVILVRSGALPFENLEECQCRFMRGMIPFLVSQNAALKTLGPGSLSPSAGAIVFRSVVATAYHISALSQSYLASCLERLRDPGFRPLHAHDLDRVTHMVTAPMTSGLERGIANLSVRPPQSLIWDSPHGWKKCGSCGLCGSYN